MIEENNSKKRKDRSGESKGISTKSGNISLLSSSNVSNKHNAHISRITATPLEAISSSGTLINSVTLMPLKKYFRTRAHCNPLSHNDGFKYPLSPSEAGWDLHYPNIDESDRIVRHVDVGMGFGGLTIALATLFPDKLVLGMEIRSKVCEYVRLRIEALRFEKIETGEYQNAACLRTNCMRYLPNFFNKGQLEKIFFCFPDPHFKAKNHRRRIVSTILLSEYAHFLAPNGRLYTVTDVEDLHNWHVAKCDAHPYFERLDNEELLKNDPAVTAILEETEESKKVARLGGKKYFAVYRRKEDSELKLPLLMNLFDPNFKNMKIDEYKFEKENKKKI